MIKTQFQKEITISGTQSKGSRANNKKDVNKIQCWLNLFAQQNPGSGASTGIDSDFGPATELAVKNFQKARRLPQTGKVDAYVFDALCEPMATAFTKTPKGKNLRELIVSAADIHLAGKPFELVVKGQSNSGPWVRAYMDGNEGDAWFWCMGFVQTIIDQAATVQGKDFRTLMPLTYSCDVVGATGLIKGLLRRFSEVRRDPSLVKPGDIFLVQKSTNDWFHTGLITGIQGDVFETVEGNTNNDGSHNGNGVYRRQRNFRQSKLDVFSIEPLV
jgi:peptidoglycan hydrolase-like protein with peptidoglycan-binding domain